MTERLEKRTGVLRNCYVNFEEAIVELFVPEITCALIADDYACSLEDAHHMAWVSDTYGRLEFPEIDDCPVLNSMRAIKDRETRMILREVDRHDNVVDVSEDDGDS